MTVITSAALGFAPTASAAASPTYAVVNTGPDAIACSAPAYEGACSYPDNVQDGDTLTFTSPGAYSIVETMPDGSTTTTPVTPAQITSVTYKFQDCNSNTGGCKTLKVNSADPSAVINWEDIGYAGTLNPGTDPDNPNPNYMSTNALQDGVTVKVQVATNQAGNPVYKSASYAGDQGNPLVFPNTPVYNSAANTEQVLISTANQVGNGLQVAAEVDGSWESPDPLHYTYVFIACSRASTSAIGTKSCIPAPNFVAGNSAASNNYKLSPAQLAEPYLTVAAQATDREDQSGVVYSPFITISDYYTPNS